jgi:hypothetical protein
MEVLKSCKFAVHRPRYVFSNFRIAPSPNLNLKYGNLKAAAAEIEGMTRRKPKSLIAFL